MAIRYQYNRQDLDDLLQPISTTKGNLTPPTIDFKGYPFKGGTLEGRYAGCDKHWHKKMPRSYLLNMQEINACLKGFYPIDRSFTSFGAGTCVLTRNDTALMLKNTSGTLLTQFTTATETFEGIIPFVVLIALCAGGGGGGGSTGTKSGGGGGGGAIGMYALNFQTADSFTITIGSYGSGGNHGSGKNSSYCRGGTGGSSIIIAKKGSTEVDRVTLNGGGGATHDGDTSDTKGYTGSISGPKSLAIHSVSGSGSAGNGGNTGSKGSGSNWNWWWGQTSTVTACTRTGSASAGDQSGKSGSGGGSFGAGGANNRSTGTNGGGGGGAGYKLFAGQSGYAGGSGIAWLYY